MTARTTVFSGDTLAVGEGVAILVVGSGSQVRLGSNTVANFIKEGNVITVQLEKGVVSISSSKDALIKVTATGVEITPAGGFKTIGHIAMLGATPGSLICYGSGRLPEDHPTRQQSRYGHERQHDHR